MIKIRGGLGSALLAGLIGPGLFLAAFVVLFRNEGRENYSILAHTAPEIGAEAVDETMDGRLVAARGTLTTDEALGDAKFLRPGPYLAVERKVEMYAWVERSKTETVDRTGSARLSR